MTEIIPNEKLFEWYIRITDLQDNFIGDFDSVTDTNGKYKNWIFKYKKV